MTPPLTASTAGDAQQVALIKSDARFRAEHGPERKWDSTDLADYEVRITRVHDGFATWKPEATA